MPIADYNERVLPIYGESIQELQDSLNIRLAVIQRKFDVALDMDVLRDGSVYGKVLLEDLDISGHITLSSTSGTLDDIADGSLYSKVKTTDISAGHVLLSSVTGDLDDISDGTSYGRVLLSALDGAVPDLSQAVGSLDDISNGPNYGKVSVTDISSGHIILSTAIGDLDDVANGSSFAKVLATVLDSGYLYIMRRQAGTNERIVITSSGIELYGNNVKVLDIANTPSITVGPVGAGLGNINITSGSINFRTNLTTVFSITNSGNAVLNSVGSTIFTSTGSIFDLRSLHSATGNYGLVRCYSDSSNGYVQITSHQGGLTRTYSFSQSGLTPPSTGTMNLGSGTSKWQNGYFSGNITVDGTVDSVDVAGLASDVSDNASAISTIDGIVTAIGLDLDGFPNELKSLATGEIQQLENIGTTTISAGQWVYLGELDQSVKISATPQFARIGIGIAANANYALYTSNNVADWNTVLLNSNSSGQGLAILSGSGSGTTNIFLCADSSLNSKFYVDLNGDATLARYLYCTDVNPPSKYPESLEKAKAVVNSFNRLPSGQYDKNDETKQLDHSNLDSFVKVKHKKVDFDGNIIEEQDRFSLVGLVTSQNEVIKNILVEIEYLKQQIL